MKKLLICIVLVAILFCNACQNSKTEASHLMIPELLMIEEVEDFKVEPVYYNILLSQELQEFIFWECYKYNISETLLYAIIHRESEFKKDLISYTNDWGIVQINYRTFNWLNEEFFNNELNINNKKDRITASIFYLDYIRDYWQTKGLCNEEIFNLCILSYHLGISGATEFVGKYGYESNYLNEVIGFKIWLETEGREVNN